MAYIINVNKTKQEQYNTQYDNEDGDEIMKYRTWIIMVKIIKDAWGLEQKKVR